MGIVLALPLAYKIRRFFTNISACSDLRPGASSWLFIIVSYLYLITWRLFGRKRLDLYKNNDLSSPAAMGAVPQEEEKKLDSAQNPDHLQKNQDEIFFYGVNTSKETLVLKASRLPGKRLEIMLYLQLKDGRTFVQPHGMSVVYYSGELEGFEGGGLRLRCLSALRKWRISFNGLLREQSSSLDEDDFKVVYVKFSFIWQALSEIYDLTSDMEPSLVSVAVQPDLIPSIKRLQEVFNAYQQDGHLFGTVTVENEDEQEVYLWGSRCRNLGVKLPEGVKESTHVFGSTPDGHTFHVSAVTIPGLCTRLHFGHLSRPNGHMNSMTSCSSNLLDMLGYDVVCEKPTYCVSFDNETCKIQVGKSCNHFNFVNSATQEDITFYPATIKYNEKEASGLVFCGHRNFRGVVTTFPKDPIKLPYPVHQLKERHLVVSFSDDECLNNDLTGGKGSSLGKLTLLAKVSPEQFSVPRGIVVTTQAYEMFIQRPELAHAVRSLEDIAWGRIKGDVQETSKRIVDLISEVPLPLDVSKAVMKRLMEIFGNDMTNMTFAVRSSASGEDSEEMSAAGQMETFLGIKEVDEVLKTVVKCWASQFTFVATEYKRRNGQSLNLPMAVIIQEMVPSEVAGVMFTCDPLTSNPSFITITANYGLGETVVSASADPDTVTLHRDYQNQLKPHSCKTGKKNVQIVIKSDGGTKTIEVPEDKANQKCILDEWTIPLGNIGIVVESSYGSARDIEWALYQGSIYLLQARPITSLHAETDFEIMHELDGSLRSETEYLTKANVGEVFPGAQSFLGATFIAPIFQVVFRIIWNKREGNRLPKSVYATRGFVQSYNHLIFNMFDFMFRDVRKDGTISNFSKAYIISMFGRLVDDPEILEMAKERNDPLPRIQSIKRIPFILWAILMSQRRLRQSRKKLFHFSIPVNHLSSSEEIYREIENNWQNIFEPLQRHGDCTLTSSMANLALLSTLVSARGEWNIDVFTDFASLLSTCSELESADVPSAMEALAHTIAKDIDREVFKSMKTEEALQWLKQTGCDAGVKFREFLEKHGHRCLKEFDLYAITWGMDPKLLVNTLKGMVGNLSVNEKKKEVNIEEAISKLHCPLSSKQRLFLKFLLPRVRLAVAGREGSKSLLIKFVDAFRKAYVYLGEVMVNEGRLSDPRLLFFLTHYEIGQLLKNRSPKLISKAFHRQRLYPKMDHLRFPEIMKGVPRPVNIKEAEPLHTDRSFLCMKGTPVSQGVVKGTATVINFLSEANNIKQGDILITYSTDIGWSPYFPLLAGVVTELGGLISHGAVVAREYGIPCVVGLHKATSCFQTGDQVLLDGTRGILQKIG